MNEEQMMLGNAIKGETKFNNGRQMLGRESAQNAEN
jgi:hypothetical protein